MVFATTIILGSCLFMLWFYFLWSRRRFYKVAWQLPGPLGLPFIGLGLNMMNPETFLQYMEKTSKKYKCPFISWMGTNCFLYVNDPETVETIFNSTHCTNKGDFYRFMATAIGDGLFTSSSPRWNKHRRLINPAFSRQVINNFLPIFNAEADVLLQKFAIEGATKKLEIYEMLKKSVLETACQTTMGKKMHFQNDGSSAIFTAYNGVTEVCVRRMLSPWLYPDVLYRLSPLFKRQQQVVDVLYDFVENLLQRGNKSTTPSSTIERTESIDSAAAKDERRQDNVDVDDSFVIGGCSSRSSSGKSKSIFVEQVRKHVDQGQLSWDDVRDEANVTIAATFETTSTALYLVCLCLAMHPEYQEKLYEELIEIFPDNSENNHSLECDVTNPNDNNNISNIISPHITNEQLERMTYTEQVINEAMRLFAPVPIVIRSASADFRLRDGTLIPSGTQISIDIFNMQRNPQVWGPRAHLYDPEHFSAESLATRHAFSFVPFTRGLRMCIGYRYALMLMKVLLAKIFRNFQIRCDARMEDLIIKGTISLKLREYPLCAVSRRKTATTTMTTSTIRTADCEQ